MIAQDAKLIARRPPSRKSAHPKITTADVVLALKHHGYTTTARHLDDYMGSGSIGSRAVATALRYATADGRVSTTFRNGRAWYRFKRLAAKPATKPRPQPDPIQALREIAPEGMPWLCFIYDGRAFWQAERGRGCIWSNRRSMPSDFACRDHALTAIHLPTGTVHLQSADGTITEVNRAEWDV